MNTEQTRNEQNKKTTAEQRASIWNYALQLSFVFEKNLDVTFNEHQNTPLQPTRQT